MMAIWVMSARGAKGVSGRGGRRVIDTDPPPFQNHVSLTVHHKALDAVYVGIGQPQVPLPGPGGGDGGAGDEAAAGNGGGEGPG